MRREIRWRALAGASALVAVLAGPGPAAADQHVKCSVRIVKPSTNQHYTGGPVVVQTAWLPGVLFDEDHPTVTVQVERIAPSAASHTWTTSIAYAGPGGDVDVSGFVAPPGKYRVRARSDSPHYPQWTDWRPFGTGTIKPGKAKPVRPAPEVDDEVLHRVPKPEPGPPPVEREAAPAPAEAPRAVEPGAARRRLPTREAPE